MRGISRITSWFWGLPYSRKAGVLAVYLVVFSLAASAALYPTATQNQTERYADASQADATEPQTLSAVIDKQIVMKFGEDMPFNKQTVKDPDLAEGESYIRTYGVNGKRNVTYEVTYTDGVETGRKVVEQEILEKPVDEVKVVGTRVDEEPEPQQVQGVNTEKNKPASDDNSPEPEEDSDTESIVYQKVWAKINGNWKKICVAPDSEYYNHNVIDTYTDPNCEITL